MTARDFAVREIAGGHRPPLQKNRSQFEAYPRRRRNSESALNATIVMPAATVQETRNSTVSIDCMGRIFVTMLSTGDHAHTATNAANRIATMPSQAGIAVR